MEDGAEEIHVPAGAGKDEHQTRLIGKDMERDIYMMAADQRVYMIVLFAKGGNPSRWKRS